MPWENTENHIRSGHRSPEEFQKDTLKTITLDEKEGIKAVIGKPKGKDTMEIQSYLFMDRECSLYTPVLTRIVSPLVALLMAACIVG